MLEPFFSVLANSLNDVEFSLWNTLMHENTVNFHQTGATTRRTQSKLLRTFCDLQLRPGPQSVTGPKRLWKNDPSEFVQFQFHRVDYAIFNWQWQVDLAIFNSGGLEKPVNFRRQDEVRLRQPIHRVRPGGDLDFAPSEQDVGMMALLLGQFAHSVHESQGGLESGNL